MNSTNSEIEDKKLIFGINKRVGRLRYVAMVSLLWSTLGMLFPIAKLIGVDTPIVIIGTIVYGIVFISWWLLVIFQRAMDIGGRAYWGLLIFIPFVNFFFNLILMFSSGSPGANMHGNKPKESHISSLLLLSLSIAFLFLGNYLFKMVHK